VGQTDVSHIVSTGLQKGVYTPAESSRVVESSLVESRRVVEFSLVESSGLV